MKKLSKIDNIGFMLQHLSASLSRIHDSLLLQELGITFSQYKILMIIKWASDIQQNQIAKQLGVTEASISRQIKLMFDEGLIQTVPNPEDRRMHITTLSKRGERITEQAIEVLKRQNEQAVSGLSKSEQDQLLVLLKTIHDNVCSQSSGFCK